MHNESRGKLLATLTECMIAPHVGAIIDADGSGVLALLKRGEESFKDIGAIYRVSVSACFGVSVLWCVWSCGVLRMQLSCYSSMVGWGGIITSLFTTRAGGWRLPTLTGDSPHARCCGRFCIIFMTVYVCVSECGRSCWRAWRTDPASWLPS